MSVFQHLKTLGVYLSGKPDFRFATNRHFTFKNTPTAIATADDVTLTAAQLLKSFINRDPAGAVRTDTTPTATKIVNALGIGVVAGSSFDVVYRNTGSLGEIITFAGGTSVTLAPTSITLNANETILLRFVVTNAATPAVTVYALSVGAQTSKVASYVLLDDDYTLTEADNGKTFAIATDAKVITLLPTIAGFKCRFINIGADDNNIVTISPNASDGIFGTLTLAASIVIMPGTADTDLINTKSGANKGDFVDLEGDGVDGWAITGSSGIWASA